MLEGKAPQRPAFASARHIQLTLRRHGKDTFFALEDARRVLDGTARLTVEGQILDLMLRGPLAMIAVAVFMRVSVMHVHYLLPPHVVSK